MVGLGFMGVNLECTETMGTVAEWGKDCGGQGSKTCWTTYSNSDSKRSTTTAIMNSKQQQQRTVNSNSHEQLKQ